MPRKKTKNHKAGEKVKEVIAKSAGAGTFGAWTAGQKVTLPIDVATAMLEGGYATEVEVPKVAKGPAKRAVEKAKETTDGPKATAMATAKAKSEEERDGGLLGVPPMPKLGK
jgi:hypothetical protein